MKFIQFLFQLFILWTVTIFNFNTVSAMKCSQTAAGPVDIMILMDKSMASCTFRNTLLTRFDNFVTEVATANTNGRDVQVGLVTYDTGLNVISTLTTNVAGVKTALSGVTCNTMSLYNGIKALKDAAEHATFWRTSSKKAIFFLSDTSAKPNDPQPTATGTNSSMEIWEAARALVLNNVRSYFVFDNGGKSYYSGRNVLTTYGNGAYSLDATTTTVNFNGSYTAEMKSINVSDPTALRSIQYRVMWADGFSYTADKTVFNGPTKIIDFYKRVIHSMLTCIEGPTDIYVAEMYPTTSSSSGSTTSGSTTSSGTTSPADKLLPPDPLPAAEVTASSFSN